MNQLELLSIYLDSEVILLTTNITFHFLPFIRHNIIFIILLNSSTYTFLQALNMNSLNTIQVIGNLCTFLYNYMIVLMDYLGYFYSLDIYDIHHPILHISRQLWEP